MAFLSWRKEYEVGVAQIDAEHRGLFALVNEYHDTCRHGSSAREAARVLNSLIVYAEAHFQHEELLMSDCGYPRLEAQREQHSQLVKSIFAINERIAADNARVNAEILPFIKNWLVGHIVNSDMDIGDYLRRKAGNITTPSAAREEDAEQSPSETVVQTERPEQAEQGEREPLEQS